MATEPQPRQFSRHGDQRARAGQNGRAGHADATVRLRADIGRWGMIPEWLLDAGVSARAVHLYAILATKYADREGRCWPVSRKTLARHLGVKAETVDAALRELVAVRGVSIQRRRGDDGVWRTNNYTVFFARPTTTNKAAQLGAENGLPSPANGTTLAREEEPEVAPESRPDPEIRSSSTDPDETGDAGASRWRCKTDEALKELRVRFERIVEVYPRADNQKRAWTMFQKLNPSDSLIEVILADIEKKKRTMWGAVEPRYITSLVNYLIDERWTDDVSDVAPYSAVELKQARRTLSARFLGRCPHGPACGSVDDCLKAIAACERERRSRD